MSTTNYFREIQLGPEAVATVIERGLYDLKLIDNEEVITWIKQREDLLWVLRLERAVETVEALAVSITLSDVERQPMEKSVEPEPVGPAGEVTA